MYKVEFWDRHMAYKATAVVADGAKISLDYISCSPFTVSLAKSVQLEKGWLCRISDGASILAECVLESWTPGDGTTSASLRPLQALFDVETFAPTSISDVGAFLAEQIIALFVSNSDTLQNIPLAVSNTATPCAADTGSELTINLLDLMTAALQRCNLFCSAALNPGAGRVDVSLQTVPDTVTFEADAGNAIAKRISFGDSYGKANKMLLRRVDGDTGEVLSTATYYLHSDGTVDDVDEDRVTPVFWTLDALDDNDTWEADALEKATQALTPARYDNQIELTYRAGDITARPMERTIGTAATVIIGGVRYASILTGRTISSGTVQLTFGCARVALTKKLIKEARQW